MPLVSPPWAHAGHAEDPGDGAAWVSAMQMALSVPSVNRQAVEEMAAATKSSMDAFQTTLQERHTVLAASEVLPRPG